MKRHTNTPKILGNHDTHANGSGQYEVAQLAKEMGRNKCFQASIHIDKSTILASDNKKTYYGELSNEDSKAAWTISAYPQGANPSAYNRLSIVAYARSGGHQEISMTLNGQSTAILSKQDKEFQGRIRLPL
jgi:hypothetical protein